MENTKRIVTWVPDKTKRMGLTASGLIIWRDYLPLATFSERGETEISSNIVFAVVCDVMRFMCA
jgi:hypothetical protein